MLVKNIEQSTIDKILKIIIIKKYRKTPSFSYGECQGIDVILQKICEKFIFLADSTF